MEHLDFSYSHRVRIFQVACAYELRFPPHIIETHCKAFENYARRNINKYRPLVKACLNFINLVRQLNKVNPNKIKLQQALEVTTTIVSQFWLKEKIDALK